MSSQNVVNRKFSFGSGPKRAVDRINKYFRDSTSISRALHNLLDKFDGDDQTDCEKKQARERLAKYRYVIYRILVQSGQSRESERCIKKRTAKEDRYGFRDSGRSYELNWIFISTKFLVLNLYATTFMKLAKQFC